MPANNLEGDLQAMQPVEGEQLHRWRGLGELCGEYTSHIQDIFAPIFSLTPAECNYSEARASSGRKPPPSALYVASNAVAVCVSLSAS